MQQSPATGQGRQPACASGSKQLTLALTDPDRTVLLDLGAELNLYPREPAEPAEPAATVTGTAETVLGLVYGRNQSEDDVQVTGTVTLADLVALFPGF
ncbi:hypothetical protein [Streptomyces sp. NPDC055210]